MAHTELAEMSLAQVFAEHATHGPSEIGTDKLTVHSYIPVYETFLLQRRASARAVLEIGAASGASALAWARYFPHAHVHAFDINLADVKFGKDHPRVSFHRRDATSLAAAADMGQLDVIVDDGSHRPADMRRALEVLGPLLARDGVYFVEDLDLYTTPQLFEDLKAAASAAGLTHSRLFDLREKKGRFDDVIAVFSPSPLLG